MSDVHTRLLREALRGRMTAASSECVDTETLAAWSEGTLRMRRRAAIEAHAANCARCQALLAAMAVTAPAPAQRAWWQATTLKWFVPLAAATVAVVLWINVSQPRRETFQLPPIPSRQLPVAGSPFAGAASARADSTAFADATEAKVAPSESASRRRAGGDKARAAADDKRVAASTALKLDDAAAPRTEARDAAAAAPRSLEAAAPPAADALARGVAETVAIAPAGVAGNANNRPITGAQTGGQTFGARMEVMSKVTVVPPLIVSADGGARWRILAAGAVERSIDGGVTWQAQSTGVFVTLTAGSAPSASVCWLVGPRGIVLRSTDGSAWERVPFPEPIDLASIRATDHLSATVRTAGGRAFSTLDGGKTWRP
jgi:hypothetical protein